MKDSAKSTNANQPPECEALVRQMKEGCSSVKNVIMQAEQYMSFNYTEQMLTDLTRFCVNGNSTFLVDTTFELCNGLWLTDSSFDNESLLNEQGKHPVFPGPFMWHFKKEKENYR